MLTLGSKGPELDTQLASQLCAANPVLSTHTEDGLVKILSQSQLSFFESSHSEQEGIVFVSCPVEQACLLCKANWAFYLFSLGSGSESSHVL